MKGDYPVMNKVIEVILTVFGWAIYPTMNNVREMN